MKQKFWLCKTPTDIFYVLNTDMDEDLWVARGVTEATFVGTREVCIVCGCNPTMRGYGLCHKCRSSEEQLFSYEPQSII